MKESKGYALTSFGMYAETLGTLRASGGDRGGGSEVLILESNQNHATIKDDEICPCLPAAMGLGGGYVPMIVDTLVFDKAQITSKLNYSVPTWGGQCHPLTSAAGEAIVIIKVAEEDDIPTDSRNY